MNDRCTDLDECKKGFNSCGASFMCKNTIGGFSCACEAGFYVYEDKCIDIRYGFELYESCALKRHLIVHCEYFEPKR